MRPDEQFTSLQIMKKALLDAHKSMYRVYKSPKEYVTVEAATALEAMRESAIKNPYKIVRQIRFKERLMDMDRLSEGDDDVTETGSVMMKAALAGAGDADDLIPEDQRPVVKEAHELRQADVRPPGAVRQEAEQPDANKGAAQEAPQEPAEKMEEIETVDVEEVEDSSPDEASEIKDDAEEQLSEDDIAKLLNSDDE